MYRVFADEVLIFDSALDDYKIGKGTITLETDKSGGFVFSVYPEHYYYDRFVPMKTVITVYKSGRIVFRGRVLDDSVDYWGVKTLTCEGEFGFLLDSVIRPYDFTGTPAEVFGKLIAEHNAQVDEFKRFKVGSCTVMDPSGSISRSNANYETTQRNLTSRLLEDTGGHFYITHGDDGRDPIPTIHYIADFTKVSTQGIEFGLNLKDYTKKVNAADIATAIIPLGGRVDDGDSETEDKRLTIAEVNGGKDYVYSETGVAIYGWIFKAVEWNDITDAATLKAKGEEYITGSVNKNITVELTAVDLHLLDRSIESYGVGEYIQISSKPHGLSARLLCNKQTLNLLSPENDTVTLGHTYSTFTESSIKSFDAVESVKTLRSSVSKLAGKVNIGSAELTSITARVEALEGVTLVTIQITVSDAVGGVEQLLTIAGTLTVSGQPVTQATASSTVHIGSAEVRYALADDLDTARTVVVNGATLGTVAVAGDTVATVLTVTNGDTVTVGFIGGNGKWL